jgi:putative glutamine amidotransferase
MKPRPLLLFLLVILVLPVLLSSWNYMGEPLRIAVSKATPNYVNWLKKGNPEIVAVNMSEIEESRVYTELNTCSGLLVTGGVDVNPALYGMPEETGRCQDIDTRRDSLEQLLIRRALEMKMPVVGICRGEQIINVLSGGTLYIDLPSDYRDAAGKPDTSVRHQCADYMHCYHPVRVEKNSLLFKITGCSKGSVTSNHHQAVHVPAPGLSCNAVSPDGVIEGIEWKYPVGKSFMIGVQWHPERMDASDPLSGKLLREFILQSEKYSGSLKQQKK